MGECAICLVPTCFKVCGNCGHGLEDFGNAPELLYRAAEYLEDLAC